MALSDANRAVKKTMGKRPGLEDSLYQERRSEFLSRLHCFGIRFVAVKYGRLSNCVGGWYVGKIDQLADSVSSAGTWTAKVNVNYGHRFRLEKEDLVRENYLPMHVMPCDAKEGSWCALEEESQSSKQNTSTTSQTSIGLSTRTRVIKAPRHKFSNMS